MLCFCVDLMLGQFVGWLAGLSAGLHKKIAERISGKLGWRFVLGPEQTPLTVGVDPNKGMDPGSFSHFL